MDGHYNYVLADARQTVEITSSAPPEEFLQSISAVTKLLGYDDIPMVVYAQADQGGLWQPIHGVREDTPVLFPLLPSRVSEELSEAKCYDIGQKILAAYKAMRDQASKLQSSKRRHEKATQVILGDLREKMGEIESVIEGTEMEALFELKYKKQEKQHVCAMKLHMSQRTLNRKTHSMTVFIGQTLYSSVNPRRLQELMRVSSERIKSVLRIS